MRSPLVPVLAFSLLAGLLLGTAPAATAGELAGVTLPDQTQAGGEKLVLNGLALRKKLMFKVYVAGLYLPQRQKDGAKVLAADTARSLTMQFVRDVGKDSICEAWYEGLEANTPGASAELEKQFDTLCQWMEDVQDKDQYVFTYVPGQGTEVTVKGKSKGTLEGKAFADALFSCWIGTHPGPGEEFKDDLLGG